MRTGNKKEKLEKLVEIYGMTPIERMQRGLVEKRMQAEYIGVNVETFNVWMNKLQDQGKDWSDFDIFVFHLKTVAMGGRGTSKDRELYAKIKGWLVEKKEETHKVEFTANDYITTTRNIIRRLREELKNGGICPVCDKPVNVLSPVCVDTKQEHSTGNQMESVAVPVTSD